MPCSLSGCHRDRSLKHREPFGGRWCWSYAPRWALGWRPVQGAMSGSLGMRAAEVLLTAVMACGLLSISSTVRGAPEAETLRFLAVGDAPYADAEYEPFERLLQTADAQHPAFIVHVGDIKGGGQPCTEARNQRVAELFEQQPVPMLYTPGDNEWTDCHRRSAGALDPLERLAALRERFFADPEVLHNETLDLRVPDADFPENAYMRKDGVMIVLMHVVGSENNRRPRDASAMEEWRARSRANRRLLQAATKAANAAEARAMVLLVHANPLFERSPPALGFVPFFDDLDWLLASYSGPVLVIHGDTHRFQFNRPLIRTGSAVPGAGRLWRLEVPGSPFLGAVWVSVTDDSSEPFAISVIYPTAAEAFGSGSAD